MASLGTPPSIYSLTAASADVSPCKRSCIIESRAPLQFLSSRENGNFCRRTAFSASSSPLVSVGVRDPRVRASSSSSSPVREAKKGFAINLIPTTPIERQKTRTSGLRKKVIVKIAAGNEVGKMLVGSTDSIESNSKDNPPIAPSLITSLGPTPLDLMSVFLRSRIIFVGEYVTSQVAQRVISQLVTLATIDRDADILMYINCPGGTPYSVLAIYDCMQWIKPKVGTVCIGIAVSHASLLLMGGEKGMRYSMPNSRIMIHQPQGGFTGNIHDVGAQVNEALSLRDKYDKIYAAVSGQPLEVIQSFSARDRYFSAAEALDVGMIDGLMETEY